MNTLLIFFALPVATIILAIVLEKILRQPILTAATAFAIYLIITFSIFDTTFLVNTIIYTILAYISAYLAEMLYRRYSDNENMCNISNSENREEVTKNLLNNTTGRGISWRCYRRS